MAEFWEKTFKINQEMWGFEPAVATLLTNTYFVEQQVKNVLVLGIGYGRNAQLFKTNGMAITGIEISKTAIDLAKKNLGKDTPIHHGSVTEMPFDNQVYDGIYCYALIHFLDKKEREKLIQDCYNQLQVNGVMVFATISKEAQLYGQGACVGKDRYELHNSLNMFFYDKQTLQEEFGKSGLVDIIEVNDVYPFYLIKCKKTE